MAAVVLVSTAQAQDPNDIVVVVNKSNATDSIDDDELRNIFLGRKTTWSDGERIVPINAKKGDDIRGLFRGKVLKMTASEENEYWVRVRMQGRGKEPAAISYQNILKAVYKVKRAIGYVRRKDLKEGVAKVVHIIRVKQ